MINTSVIAVRVGIFCKNEEWGRETLEDFCFLIPDDCIQTRMKDRVCFRDGSVIQVIRVRNELSVRGYKFDKVFVQQNIDEDFVNTYIKPCLVNRNYRVYREYIDEETRQKCFV